MLLRLTSSRVIFGGTRARLRILVSTSSLTKLTDV
jgi:hypothetical protein